MSEMPQIFKMLYRAADTSVLGQHLAAGWKRELNSILLAEDRWRLPMPRRLNLIYRIPNARDHREVRASITRCLTTLSRPLPSYSNFAGMIEFRQSLCGRCGQILNRAAMRFPVEYKINPVFRFALTSKPIQWIWPCYVSNVSNSAILCALWPSP